MRTPPTNSPPKAEPRAAVRVAVNRVGNTPTRHYSRKHPDEQGSAKAPQCFAIADGRVTVGCVIACGAQWLARDANGCDVGLYPTMEQAMERYQRGRCDYEQSHHQIHRRRAV